MPGKKHEEYLEAKKKEMGAHEDEDKDKGAQKTKKKGNYTK
ncbi:MAG: hypothetical protein CM15mV101_400 [uncultured marine virus]|nr:MAG: hypothetical protein CM15mV101_400 [uncultured marine virus]